MADFIAREASESDVTDSDAGSAKGKSTGDSTDSDEEPVAKKQKKEKKLKRKAGSSSKKDKKKRRINSSDEDEEDSEDEEEQAKEEMKGFLVDEPEEEEVEEGNASDRNSEKSNSDVDLDDEDLALIRENAGEVDGVKKKGRTARIEDSDEDEEDRDKISKEIFGFGEDEDEPMSSRREPVREDPSDRSGSDSNDEEDNFIEYDKEERRGMKQRNRKRKEMNFADGALDEARDIFGVEDFNFDEFYDEGEEPEQNDDEQYMSDDGEEKPRPRRREVKARETLLDTMEPSELEKGYFAPEDKRIQQEDKPERFLCRRVPIVEATEEELELESHWIYIHGFKERPLTKQDDTGLTRLQDDNLREEDIEAIHNEAPGHIKETLRYIRNSAFEVPFIGFYRKEGVADLLNINDLWKVYKWDQKWCHLLNRRNKLIALMRRMQAYLEDSGEQHHKPLTDNDYYDVEAVQSTEALADVQAQFQLFYAPDLAKMSEWEAQKRLEEGVPEEGAEGERDFMGLLAKPQFKQATRKDKYQMCVEYGLGELAARFGLTAKQFAENLDWRRHDVEQDSVDPFIAAEDYITTSFSTVKEVIAGSIFMLAKQISREPLVRTRMREHYRRRAVLSVRPTQKGRETLDDSHPIWRKRYIKEKPIADLEGDDYLHYHLLRESGMLEVRLEVDKKVDESINNGLLENILQEQPFYRDEYTAVAEAWNALRKDVVTMAIRDMLLPEFRAEMEARLLEEAREYVVKRCSEAMYTRLLHSSFKAPRNMDADDDEDENQGGVRILGIVYSTERDEVSFGALVDQDGSVIDTIRLPYLMNRRGPQEERQKREDMAKLTRFVHKHQPHVIAVAGESLQARFVKNDMERVVMQLFQENKISSNIQVVIHDNDAAKVYMQSKQSVAEHPDYPPNLRQALSLARCLLDPLVEYAHLYNTDEDIFCLALHPLQADVNKDELHEAVMLELINRVNEVGVDINKCVEFSHHSGLLQFVCGLGPRKAAHLLKTIRQNSSCLESRTKLVTLCKIGPKVFMNCSGFIKIDTVRIQERSTDAYVEILDGSRVHPETYEWARKMAVDALEVDDATDPTAALEEVLQSPDRLKDLDLDAFADELARQSFGNKRLTLYDIRSELFCRYKDLRPEYQEPNSTVLFGMLTKETTQTLFTGKLITGRVERVVYRRVDPNDDRGRQEPIRDENSDMWKCAYCGKKMEDISLLFEHYSEQDLEKGGCPGTPIGIRLRLDNGLTGFIHNKQISDNANFKSPAERVKLGQVLHARVLKVDPEKYSVDLTCKSSDLRKTDGWFDADDHWDDEAEKEDRHRDEEMQDKKKNAAANQFVKRVISHPNFHNVTYKDAERMLSKLEQGDAIIRPSSKSANNLTVTWKVTEGIYCHVDVVEHEKINQFTLGKKLIIGGGEEFEDLEEIISRYVQPMASYCREVLNHRYAFEHSQSEKKDEIEAHLHQMKRNNAANIPYCFTPSAAYPGKFTINYLVGKVRQEYFTPQPDGLRFRKQLFTSLEAMLGWFKLHYREPPQGASYGGRSYR